MTNTQQTRSRQRLSPVWIAVAIALVIAAAAGYGFGARQRPAGSGVATGRAYLGLDQGTVRVDGTAYGFAIDANSMNWFDAQGSHQGGIPPCLQNRPGYAWIRFGYSTASGPDDSSWPTVAWVQCVAAP